MSKNDGSLQQKAYPSASAFDTAPAEPVQDAGGAFGSTTLLPRVPRQQPVAPEAFDTDAFGAETPEGASGESAGAFGGETLVTSGDVPGQPQPSSPAELGAGGSRLPTVGIPVVSLAEVRDPQLRDRLAHLRAPAEYPATDSVTSLGVETSDTPAAPVNQASSPAPTGLQQASYPSVSTQGVPAPATPEARKRPSRVRSSLRSFISTEQSVTRPVRGIARLAQRPFALSAAAASRDQYVREKEHAREVLNFSLRLAETMFHYGADTVDVDSALVAVCAAYGLDDVEVDITNQSVIINYVSDIDVVDDKTRAISLDGSVAPADAGRERFSHTVMRVVRSWSENYAALDDTYRLINDITDKGLPRHRAERRLKAINSAPKPYSPLVIMLANVTAAFSLVLALGGTLAAATLGGLVFIAIHGVNSLISRLRMPNFFTMATGAGVVTFAAIYVSDESSIFSQIGFHVHAPHIVAAGLMMLLPTAKLVSTVQDALNGFPLTAAGKFVSTGMSFLGIVVGLASAVAVLSALGVPELNIRETVFNPPHLVITYIFFMTASLAFAVTTHARWRTLLWILLIASCGFWGYHLFTHMFGAGSGRANTAFAALVMGLMSTFIAYRLKGPASIFYVPAVTFLLPGLAVFRGLYLFTVESNSSAGVPGIISAVSVIVSLAAGVVLGSYLMQYAIQRFATESAGKDGGWEPSEKLDR